MEITSKSYLSPLSTPQAKAPASKAAKTLDNPLLHALEDAVSLPEQEPVFTVYDDIRQKLIAQGMPADQIAFIHEANTEVRKKELFSKVRTGQVRVLLGSTAKMGAGTNVQDRLVALHDLDCPWRPGDLAQRKGRIERQGNQNPLVHVYRYVTEGIIAVGQIVTDTPTEVGDEKYHSVRMIVPENFNGDVKALPALSPNEIKTILKRNFYWASTIKTPFLTGAQVEMLIRELKKKHI